jgi:tryptophan-rich sensory protein
MIKNKYISLFSFVIITFAASAIGGFSTRISKEPWYSSINKPSFNPPDWVFAPVWTTLYIFMAVAVWLIWINQKKIKKIFYVYFVHLFFNATWSVIFFGFHQIFLALINILLIIFFIIWLIKLYLPLNKFSAYLMIPYLVWCCYAFILNLNLFLLN